MTNKTGSTDETRTELDDLRESLGLDRGDNLGPFIRWSKAEVDDYVLGRVKSIWESKFGPVAHILVEKLRGDLFDQQAGSGTPENVNCGLALTTLHNTIRQEDIGRRVLISYHGKRTAKSGYAYRDVKVEFLTDRPASQADEEGGILTARGDPPTAAGERDQGTDRQAK